MIPHFHLTRLNNFTDSVKQINGLVDINTQVSTWYDSLINRFNIFRVTVVLRIDTLSHGRFCKSIPRNAIINSRIKPNQTEWNAPQIMSNVHKVMYLNKLNPSSLSATCDNLFTKTALCSWNTSMKSSKILKWNVGVKIWNETNAIDTMSNVWFREEKNHLSSESDCHEIIYEHTFRRECHFLPCDVRRPVPSQGCR